MSFLLHRPHCSQVMDVGRTAPGAAVYCPHCQAQLLAYLREQQRVQAVSMRRC